MRCNKKNIVAALCGVGFLAMPIAANAQALGLRLGGTTVLGGPSTGGSASGGINIGGGTTGLGGLGSTLGGITGGVTGTNGLGVTVSPLATSGLIAANTGAIGANVLGSNGLLTANVAPIGANVANGLATLNTPSIGAGVLSNGSIATVTTGGPLNVGLLGGGTNPPLVNVNIGGPTGPSGPAGPAGPTQVVTLGNDGFFSGNILFRGGGGGGGGFSAGADSYSESYAQACERVLRRPASYQRDVVRQCRRIVAELARR